MVPEAGARRLGTALLLLVVTGCAANRGIELPEFTDWATRTRTLAGIDDWEFKGRIGVSAAGDGFNGKLRYQQSKNHFRATVSGPLGFGTVRIQGNGRRVTVTDKDGKQTVLQEPESALRSMYGWTIPVSSLRFWALGIPDPALPAGIDFNDDGQLASLDQGNWHIAIDQYRDGGGQAMPRRLTAVSGDDRVRLVIDNWTFR
jgi:outer membrane lipoprotein LolB